MTPKPQIFIVSTSEATSELDALTILLGRGHWALIKPWDVSLEFSGTSTLSALLKIADEIDFAIILYTGDDIVSSRGTMLSGPRDNVLFELGFFLARLGPDRVLVVSPKRAPKIPSNYAGYGTISYDPSYGSSEEYLVPAAREIQKRFAEVWQQKCAQTTERRATELFPTERVEPVDIIFKKSRAGLVPIYRDLASTMDWFAELENNMRLPERHLNSKLIYYGPGLAQFWFQIAREGAANREVTSALKGSIAVLFEPLIAPNMNIIDLGVGDFEKGHLILEYILQHKFVETINYFPLDVSYEMLVLALNTRGEHFGSSTLRAIQQHGSVTALNATFSQLRSYTHLFSPPGRNIFLLLGNTIGNETVEIQTLTEISYGMNKGDTLVMEVQLIERDPPTLEEDNSAIQRHKQFYTGPLRLCGYDSHDIALSIRRNDDSDRARGIEAKTYEVCCTLKSDRTVYNPAFTSGQLFIPAGEVCVYTIRLYAEESMTDLCLRAGLQVKATHLIAGDTNSSRRFLYIVSEKV
jgi:hypothetical protein